MNVLIINGHPRPNSLSDAFVTAYAEGASAGGMQVKRIDVRELIFEPNVLTRTEVPQKSESDIISSRLLITWANHIVFFYPIWWGTMPALLKAFIDRVLVSNFAFIEIEGGTGYAPLLTGKTAQLVVTMDTPKIVYKYIYRAPGDNAMKRATLRFCGFKMAPTLYFGPVKNSTESKRKEWIEKVRKAGGKLKNGSLPALTLLKIEVGNWLKAIRLQFYPMTFLAYLLGSLAVDLVGKGEFDTNVFWLGYLWIFFLEVSTVLSNDYFDLNSDRINEFFSPFTGGSRVIVEQKISAQSVKIAAIIFVVLALCMLIIAGLISSGSQIEIGLASFVLAFLALGYTIPPVKLVYRGFGELTVCLTHSFAVIIAGYLFQGGRIKDPYPWIISIPLFFAILPSIIMAGIPDKEADEANRKKTIAVMWDKRNAARIALILTWIAVVSVVVIQFYLSGSRYLTTFCLS